SAPLSCGQGVIFDWEFRSGISEHDVSFARFFLPYWSHSSGLRRCEGFRRVHFGARNRKSSHFG
ncbi:MAG: hypothetical protein ACI91J_000663, partial [Yoonia sp.]